MQEPDLTVESTIGFEAWLNRPISQTWCVISWLVASALFYGVAGLLGGPSEGDVSESVYGTWSIAHGNLACVYPPLTNSHLLPVANPFAWSAPLYPLITGAAAAILRIGHGAAFPSQSQLGPNCDNAIKAIFKWSEHSSAIVPSIHLSYLIWPILVAGTVMVLRSSGRGRRLWEPFTLFVLACTPPVVMCLTYYFHPQDLLAMGLLLAGVGLALKRRWFWAGAILGLAFCSQQFALLALAPLIVIAPRSARLKFAGAALLAVVIVDVPLVVATSGRAFESALFGSSRVGKDLRSAGGTVLWELNLRGIPLFVISRVVPIALAMAIALWAKRRFEARVLEPLPVMSIVAASLIARLAFEVNLFGYYFMATAVALIMLDVVNGRFRGTTLCWLALDALAYNPVHFGFYSNLTIHTAQFYDYFPYIPFAIVAASILIDVARRRLQIYKMLWLVIAALTGETRLLDRYHPLLSLPGWLWQVILVPTAFALALSTLLKRSVTPDLENSAVVV